ncbi:hypothetical protein GGH93_006249, partial [Coemansia aciculifera]
LTLDSSAVCVLPSICGETLKVLKLDEVPRNFAWHHFRYDMFDHPIVFRQLTVLHLSFEHKDIDLTEDEVQDKIASGAHNCDQLCFPALRELVIYNCTPDCDLLYADLPFPELKYVHLTGSINSIRHYSRLSFTRVRNLSVLIFSADSDDKAEIYRVTNHLFTNIRIGRAASLCVTDDWFTLDLDVMRWANLTKLEIPSVDYATVCKAIGQLPNLRELTIRSLATSSSIEDLSLFINADPMLAWGEKLAKLTIRDFSEDCSLTVCVGEIQALILHADALEKLEVPYSAMQDVTTYGLVTASRRSPSKARPLWTSNAELLISRGCILAARRLTIEWSYRATPDDLRFIVLKLLRLDRVDWQHIYSLTITLDTWTLGRPIILVSLDERAATDVARTVQYFAQNLRNIAELDLKIKVLELTLDSSAVRVLPSICGETLKVLKLDEVPHNFAWHHFRYDDMFDRPIVFRQLTVLHLNFEYKDIDLTEVEIQDKIVSGAHCCDQLCFPALRELVIDNCTPDCDLLYADLPFPELKCVRLSGTIDSIRHCIRLRFTRVRDLKVGIFSWSLGDTADIYRATHHFFTNIFIGQTASLSVIVDWFILDPDVMRWANLTKLEIPSVDYATVCKAIGQLPNLRELTIRSLATSSSIEDLSLFINADPMLAWGEKLAKLTIRDFSEDCSLTVCVGEIQALILHAGALEKLSVPKSAIQPLVAYIKTHRGRYPHLAKIMLRKKKTAVFL